MSERRSRSRKKKRRGLKIFLFLVLVLFVGAGVYVLNVVRHVDKATDEVYESVEGVDPIRGSAVTLGEEQPISILLLGVDTGDLGRVEQGRSDSMMVATINPNTGKAVLISIPRPELFIGFQKTP